MKRWTLMALAVLLLPAAAVAAVYDYPFINALQATVIGTPSVYAAKLPEQIPLEKRTLKVFDDRPLPDVFWYSEPLNYSLVRQKHEAPLIFIVAGPGASYQSAKVVALQKAFYQAGFHSIAISSPTYMNFIVNASRSMVPGDIEQDAEDIYRVMELAYRQVAGRMRVSAFYLTGYSLGATQSAYITRLDEQRQVFNFKKVLMLNPSVSLYNSVRVLDKMLADTVGDAPGAYSIYMGRVMRVFASVYDRSEPLEFNEDFLYKVYERRGGATDAGLESLIGFSFRVSSVNMIFTADVMSHYGFVVPPDTHLGQTSNLDPYLYVLARTSFEDYFDKFFLPYFKRRDPSVTREQMIEALSLKPIEGYLRQTDKIAMMTNADDIILSPAEVDWLEAVFGARAKIWPTGGHCGNLTHRVVMAYIVDYFKR